ncbi:MULTISPECIES: L-rhamnose mutarotase [Clostridium]|uniref:L-rhamnose mutarotase n=1 Tax=Clostridium cibarium TaxID=2762247 RepID=A0ABR8PRG7_9CLOT|nr:MULTISPECIES: L-rhamnose mutarotase [Clostridium]MBD7910752.1 L-rhamnose mutarotase [Clostridium cibarium]
MIQKAFKMKLFAGQEEEYKRRHDSIWPELAQTLKEHGAHTYLIFHDKESNYLFAYIEMEGVEMWDKVAKTEICKKWWDHMKDIMETNPDNSPISIELSKVFNLK